jgi:hypothetical protein
MLPPNRKHTYNGREEVDTAEGATGGGAQDMPFLETRSSLSTTALPVLSHALLLSRAFSPSELGFLFSFLFSFLFFFLGDL